MGYTRAAATLACIAAVGGTTFAATALAADPGYGGPGVYTFTDCTGGVDDFDAYKRLGGAAALHLADGRTFVVIEAVAEGNSDVPDGTILFETPGFDKNGRPTIVCLNTSATSGITAWTTGFFAPSKK